MSFKFQLVSLVKIHKRLKLLYSNALVSPNDIRGINLSRRILQINLFHLIVATNQLIAN